MFKSEIIKCFESFMVKNDDGVFDISYGTFGCSLYGNVKDNITDMFLEKSMSDNQYKLCLSHSFAYGGVSFEYNRNTYFNNETLKIDRYVDRDGKGMMIVKTAEGNYKIFNKSFTETEAKSELIDFIAPIVKI